MVFSRPLSSLGKWPAIVFVPPPRHGNIPPNREETPLRKKPARSSEGMSGLRDQVNEMDSRIRDLETRLQDTSGPRENAHRPRSLSFSGERGADLAAGVKSARVPDAVDTPNCGSWTKNHNFHDNLIVRSNAASGMEDKGGSVPCADLGGGINELNVTIADEAAITGARHWEGIVRSKIESKRIRSRGRPLGRSPDRGRGTDKRGSSDRGGRDDRFSSPGIVLI